MRREPLLPAPISARAEIGAGRPGPNDDLICNMGITYE